MATNSYIQRNYNELPVDNGKRLMLNIIGIRRNKGTKTIDLPVPSKEASLRQLLPLTGQINDISIVCNLYEESSNVAYDVTSLGGDTTPDTVNTIIEQYNYLFDELLSPDINKSYKLYLDWLDKAYIGQIEIESNASPDDFTGIVEVVITFKQGGNFLAI